MVYSSRDMATIDSHYFRVCVDGTARQGFSADDLYRRSGIDPAHILEPGRRESIDKMAALVQDIWNSLDDEFMGYTKRPIRRGAFEVMATYAAEADSLLEALQRGIAFYRVATDDVITTFTPSGETVTLSAALSEPALDPAHYFIEFWMIIWHRLACWLGGRTIPIVSAEFSYPKPIDYFDEFRRLFPCPLEFDRDECRLHFHRDDLMAPIKRSRAEVAAMIEAAPLELMTIPASDTSLTRRVYVALRPGPMGTYRNPSLGEVAASLNMSSTALRRGLKRENTSFRQIGEDIRRELACAKLRHSAAAIENIAAEIGYLETRSFSRAFRDWTGMSPSAFRERYQEEN